MVSEKTCFLYVLATRPDVSTYGPVKIGIAVDVKSRVAALQTGCPTKIEVLHSFACPSRAIAHRIEQDFHKVARGQRVCGEWFDVSPYYALEATYSLMSSAKEFFPIIFGHAITFNADEIASAHHKALAHKKEGRIEARFADSWPVEN